MTVTIKVTGLKECEAGLDDLKAAVARGVVRRALTRAATLVADDARRRVKRDTGETARGLTVSTKLNKRQSKLLRKRGGKEAVQVFAGVGGKRRGSTAHLLEFGTAHAAPKPFLRPAADETAERQTGAFVGELRVELDKAKARMKRKSAKALAASQGR